MLAYYLDTIYKHIIFVENLKQKVMKILTNKKYYELIAKMFDQDIKIYDQEQELTRKNTHINFLLSKCDDLSIQNQQLSAKVSELEPIVEKFNHKKNLEKARKKKYMANLKLNKKQTESTDDNTKSISKAEEFVRLMSSKKCYTTLTKKELEVFQDIEKVADMF